MYHIQDPIQPIETCDFSGVQYEILSVITPIINLL